MKETIFTLDSINTVIETISFTYNEFNDKNFARRLLKYIAKNQMCAAERDALIDLCNDKVYQHNLRHKDYVERAIEMIKDAYSSILYNDKWITASISDSKKVTIKVWQDDSLELPDNEL